jgi:hypothetical protein
MYIIIYIHLEYCHLHYSMSMLCGFIKDNGILYDTNIITRLDLFSSIKSFGNCLHVMIDSIAYIWRTIPY